MTKGFFHRDRERQHSRAGGSRLAAGKAGAAARGTEALL